MTHGRTNSEQTPVLASQTRRHFSHWLVTATSAHCLMKLFSRLENSDQQGAISTVKLRHLSILTSHVMSNFSLHLPKIHTLVGSGCLRSWEADAKLSTACSISAVGSRQVAEFSRSFSSFFYSHSVYHIVIVSLTLTLMIMSLVGDAFNAHIHSIQYLSNLLLNIVTDVELTLTTSCGKLFQILTTRRLKKFFRRSSRERWTDNSQSMVVIWWRWHVQRCLHS